MSAIPEYYQAFRDGPKYHPERFPAEGSARYAVAQRHENGAAELGVFVMMRGRWHIVEANYQRWIQRELQAA
jgi:hypothetical protein